MTPANRAESVTNRLRRIRGVTWEWSVADHESYRPGRQMGVIAQEVQAVFPDAVVLGEDGYLRVDYNGLLAPVIEAIKERDARVAGLEAVLSTYVPAHPDEMNADGGRERRQPEERRAD